MAVESAIDAEDEWFVGEDKVLRWTVRPPKRPREVEDITGWTAEVIFTDRRSTDPLLTLPATVNDGPNGILVAAVSGAQSTTMGPGSYRYALWRTDPGARGVLAFGPAVLRER